MERSRGLLHVPWRKTEELRQDLLPLAKGDPSLVSAWAAKHNRGPLEGLDLIELRQLAAKLRIDVSGTSKKSFVDALAQRVGVAAFELSKHRKKKEGFKSWLDTLIWS